MSTHTSDQAPHFVHHSAAHALTRMTFFFPLPIAACCAAPGSAGGAALSCAAMPALIVSTRIPAGTVGEYGEKRCASVGAGPGGCAVRPFGFCPSAVGAAAAAGAGKAAFPLAFLSTGAAGADGAKVGVV
jgi:hypothetical protein